MVKRFEENVQWNACQGFLGVRKSGFRFYACREMKLTANFEASGPSAMGESPLRRLIFV